MSFVFTNCRMNRLKKTTCLTALLCLIVSTHSSIAGAQYLDDEVGPPRDEGPIFASMGMAVVGMENFGKTYANPTLGINFGSYLAFDMEIGFEVIGGQPDEPQKFTLALGPRLYLTDSRIAPFINAKAQGTFGGEKARFSLIPTLGLEYLFHNGFSVSNFFLSFEGGIHYSIHDKSVVSQIRLGSGYRF